MRQTLAKHISTYVMGMENCRKRIENPVNDADRDLAKIWFTEHRKTIDRLVSEHMPNGNGFDRGTYFDDDNSTSEKLIFRTHFHHMNKNGLYDGWTDHKVIVTPTFIGYNIQIGGKNRNDIKDIIHEYFRECLDCEVDA